MRDPFEQWYADCITTQLAQGINVDHINVDCGFRAIKNLHAKWIISTYNFLKTRNDDILAGFRKAGISDAVNGSIDLHLNPFWDLQMNENS